MRQEEYSIASLNLSCASNPAMKIARIVIHYQILISMRNEYQNLPVFGRLYMIPHICNFSNEIKYPANKNLKFGFLNSLNNV